MPQKFHHISLLTTSGANAPLSVRQYVTSAASTTQYLSTRQSASPSSSNEQPSSLGCTNPRAGLLFVNYKLLTRPQTGFFRARATWMNAFMGASTTHEPSAPTVIGSNNSRRQRSIHSAADASDICVTGNLERKRAIRGPSESG